MGFQNRHSYVHTYIHSFESAELDLNTRVEMTERKGTLLINPFVIIIAFARLTWAVEDLESGYM